MWFDILVSADPFFDRKATLQQSTTSSDFCFAICCQISINCMLSILHVCNLTAHKNQAHKRRNAQFFTGKWKQKIFEFFFFFFKCPPKNLQRQVFHWIKHQTNLFLFLALKYVFLYGNLQVYYATLALLLLKMAEIYFITQWNILLKYFFFISTFTILLHLRTLILCSNFSQMIYKCLCCHFYHQLQYSMSRFKWKIVRGMKQSLLLHKSTLYVIMII